MLPACVTKNFGKTFEKYFLINCADRSLLIQLNFFTYFNFTKKIFHSQKRKGIKKPISIYCFKVGQS